MTKTKGQKIIEYDGKDDGSRIIDYYIIITLHTIPSIITIENRYQIDFGVPAGD